MRAESVSATMTGNGSGNGDGWPITMQLPDRRWPALFDAAMVSARHRHDNSPYSGAISRRLFQLAAFNAAGP